MGKGYRLYEGVSHFVPIPHPRILTPTRMGLRTNYHIYTVYESPARVRTELYREEILVFWEPILLRVPIGTIVLARLD